MAELNNLPIVVEQWGFGEREILLRRGRVGDSTDEVTRI